MSGLKTTHSCVVSGERVSCPSSGTDKDIEACFNCEHVLEIADRPVGKVVRCVSPIEPCDPTEV